MEGGWNKRVGMKQWDRPGVWKKEVAEVKQGMEGRWEKEKNGGGKGRRMERKRELTG